MFNKIIYIRFTEDIPFNNKTHNEKEKLKAIRKQKGLGS